MDLVHKLRYFEQEWQDCSRPPLFTFPFYYVPHSLAVEASDRLKRLLELNPWKHNFGLDPKMEGLIIGKMFGVLVVEDSSGRLAYLFAVSGKLADSNEHEEFVPPVFDLLQSDGFYKKEEAHLTALTHRIEQLDAQGNSDIAREERDLAIISAKNKLENFKIQAKLAKKNRDQRRNTAFQQLNADELAALEEELRQESVAYSFGLKKVSKEVGEEIEKVQRDYETSIAAFEKLKEERRSRSNALQQKIFRHYTFLNARSEEQSLLAIFGIQPPAGAGECAAPKLLHYAYQHQLKPIAMAEFWWGASPKSEVRKHGEFYPSCRGKCEPILGHMLGGLEVEANPMLQNPAEGKDLEFLYEEEAFAIVNKPSEFLSVPGKNISDSVYARVLERYPKATGPIIVHRLDQSTSGLMVVALNDESYQNLQQQFIQRKVKKKYMALLEGTLKEAQGIIDLPLRVDLDNRPTQLVCYKHGKPAQTHFKVVDTDGRQTLIAFRPITGRTHQLRVHSAHQLGLNAPIVGDDLYGKRAHRLHLHASELIFSHPESGQKMRFTSEADFTK